MTRCRPARGKVSSFSLRPPDGAKRKYLTFICIHVSLHLYMRELQTPEEVRSWFIKALRQLWPVATGSLSLRRGRCIRPNCPTCASGKLHSSYALYGRRGKRRFSLYVPNRIVPAVRKAIRHGRRLQELINEAGVRYVRALKRDDVSKLPKR